MYSSIDSLLGKSAKDLERKYFVQALQPPLDRFKVSNVFLSSTGKLNVTATYPVFNPDRTLAGFSLAELDLSFFQKWLNRIENPSVTIRILDENKILLARKPAVQEVGHPLEIEILDDFLKSDQRMGTYRLNSPLDQADRFWSIQRIRGLPFVVIVGYPVDTALAAWRQKLVDFLVGLVVIWVVTILLALRHLTTIRLLGELREALSHIKILCPEGMNAFIPSGHPGYSTLSGHT